MAYTHTIAYTSEMESYWAGQSMFADTVKAVQPASTLGCHGVRMSWSRDTPAGTTEDRATIGFHVAKVVGGGLFSPLTLAELPAIETALDTLLTTLKPHMSTEFHMLEYRWFEHRASHAAYPDGSEVVGAPVRITAKAIAGTAAVNRLPDQDSATVTWRTTSRRHWGRVYFPGLTPNEMSAYGRLDSAYVDALAGAWHVFIASLVTNAQTLGVWTYRKKAFLDLSELRVDNVVDIQRRRRVKQSSYAKSYTS